MFWTTAILWKIINVLGVPDQKGQVLSGQNKKIFFLSYT